MTSYAAVPQQLKDIPHWVVWKHEVRKGKRTKPPRDANTNGSSYASTTDQNTWTTFDKAVDVADILSGNGADGTGFVFTDTSLQGADLDGVAQPGDVAGD